MTSQVKSGVDLGIRQFREAGGSYAAAVRGGAWPPATAPRHLQRPSDRIFQRGDLTGQSISGDALKSCGHEAWAAGKEVPWLFVLTHEELETGVDAGSILDGCGLSSVMPLTGMLAQQVPSVATNPGSLQLTVPEDDAGCSAVIDVNSAAYEMDLGAASPQLAHAPSGTITFPCWGWSVARQPAARLS